MKIINLHPLHLEMFTDEQWAKATKLYLDDERITPEGWARVSNYDEFVEYITKNGVPDFISFDHDLADEHYQNWHKNKGQAVQYDDNTEKTGYECAKWLVEKEYIIPAFSVHSMNGPGGDNILGLLNNWQKFNGQTPNGFRFYW